MLKKSAFSLFSVLVFAFLVAPSSHGAIIKATNAAKDDESGSIRKIYFPLMGSALIGGGECAGTNTKTFINGVFGAPAIDPTIAGAKMSFTIQAEKSLATINGATVDGDDISIRAELVDDLGQNKIALIDDEGLGYNDTGATPYFVDYGTTEGVARKFSISLLNNDISGRTVNGYCTEANAGTLCQRGPTDNPVTVRVKFGLVKGTSNLGDDADFDLSEEIDLILVDCPPGKSSGTLTTPTVNFDLTPGDGRLKVLNKSSRPTDSSGIPIQSILVFGAESATPSVENSPIKQEFLAPDGGTHTITNLKNDTEYCFSLGWVNYGGLVSTDAAWNSTLPGYSGSTSACATPSQIDGFLNRSTCFLASAAYKNEWDPRLETFRQFRDQVLRRFAWGRAFETWYYDWSPAAAHWVLKRPWAQKAVRALLVPVYETASFTLWINEHIRRKR